MKDFSNHSYSENPSKKRGYCFFCTKKSNIKPNKEPKSAESLLYLTLELNKEDISEIEEKKRPKQERF